MTIRGSSPIVLAVWPAVIGGICFLASLRQPSMWIPTGLSLILAAVVLAWGRAFSVEISSDSLIYIAPFRRRVSVKLVAIGEAVIAAGSGTFRDRLNPTIRLLVKPNTGSPAASFAINLKVFRRHDINELIQHLADAGIPTNALQE